MALWIVIGIVVLIALIVLPSLRRIGPTQVGLVTKRFSFKKLSEDNPIAFKGEAGYQADLLMPGLRFKFWILYKVSKFPWVQVPAGEIGVVIAQVGEPLPIGAKSAVYKPEFGNFTDLDALHRQRRPEGRAAPGAAARHPGPHPSGRLPGHHQEPGLRPARSRRNSTNWRTRTAGSTPQSFGLMAEPPRPGAHRAPARRRRRARHRHGRHRHHLRGRSPAVGGHRQPPGRVRRRQEMESKGAGDLELIELLLGSKNDLHNNYQDFQAFLDNGGKIGLQHDPLLYGAYALNPFLVSVELVPMLVVEQGQVAVIKAYVGLATEDTSGAEFKFGSLVRPGHRGIWQEPLRTGKYPINPRCYQAEIVPTAILTLNWAEATSEAHNLDRQLRQIVAKSREGFVFNIDLQVQIHVPDTKAPKVISMVGTMQNLVNEVLQAAVGNHFRDKLQSMPAVQFIETRQQVQEEAFEHISDKLDEYQVETRGVYIQDVIFPPDLVRVLTEREIANQEIETFQKQKDAQTQRIETEQAKGTADMQAELAKSKVGVDIKTNNANARKAEADGEATYIRETGAAKGAEVEAVGMARAKAYKAQVAALGQGPTALVNSVDALSKSGVSFVPQILVAGGGNGGILEALAAQIMGSISRQGTVPAAAAGSSHGRVGLGAFGGAAVRHRPGPSPTRRGVKGQVLFIAFQLRLHLRSTVRGMSRNKT